MREQKKVFIISMIIFILFLCITFFLAYNKKNHEADDLYATAYNISLGILASSILVMASSYASYLSHKQETINELWIDGEIYMQHYSVFVIRNGEIRFDKLDSATKNALMEEITELQVEYAKNVLSKSRYQSFYKKSRTNNNVTAMKNDFDKMNIAIGSISKAMLLSDEDIKTKFNNSMIDLILSKPIIDEAEKYLFAIARQHGIMY